MTPFLWLILGCVVLAIVAGLARRRSFRKLSDWGDGEFVRVFRQAFDGKPTAIIQERNFIAKVLGVSPKKLHPNQLFKDLSSLSFDVGFDVAIGDLEYDLMDLRKRAGVATGSHFPDTIGELVSELMALRKTIEDQN